MKRLIGTFILLIAATLPARADITQPIYVIDSPTAGLLGHGEYHIQGRFGPQSSVLVAARIGVKGIFHFGLSYGAQRIFERGSVNFNDRIGLMLRARVVQEGSGPAVAIGFNSQGTGVWDTDRERYERKSKGFYGVLSKNWKIILGQLALHGGLNYSLETTDEDGINAFAGLDWEIVHGVSVLGDWDAGLNDRENDQFYGQGNTYLDAALRVFFGEHITMMLIFRDLTKNYAPNPDIWREFEVSFIDAF